MKSNNFYTILPSNSCPLIHPDNNASKFIVELQNPIYLKESWEVALLDFTFVYYTFPIYSGAKINYEGFKEESEEISISVNNKDKKLTLVSSQDCIIKIKENILLNIYCKAYPYNLIFDNIENAKRFGYNELVNVITRPNSNILFQSFKPDNTTETLQIKISYQILTKNEVKFKDELYLSDLTQLVTYFLQNCSHIFKDFNIKDDLNYFSLHENINSVKFDEILTKTLGLEKQQYFRGEMVTIPDLQFKSVSKPKIQKHQQMFIYSSIVEPIIVGDVNVPLLKSVWIEKHENDEVGQIIVENPMYLPIATTCINNIEINSRDDSGKLIKFAKDSKTHLTLHFRKTNV